MKKLVLFTISLIGILLFINGESETGLAMSSLGFMGELRDKADEFSNFEDFEDYYTGEGDELLDFSSGVSFASHSSTDRTFSINMTSTFTETKKVRLFGHTKYGEEMFNEPFTIVDGVIHSDDGVDVSRKITVAGTPNTVTSLLVWLTMNPTVLKSFQIQNKTSVAQTSVIIEMMQFSPFRSMPSQPFNLSAYKNEYQQQDHITTVQDFNQVISWQNSWVFDLHTGTTTLTLYFGGAMNTTKALDRKNQRAHNIISKVGGANVVKRMEQRKNPIAISKLN